jgi:ubiquinone/menaquinone biosynthesis C-methylase UbiE
MIMYIPLHKQHPSSSEVVMAVSIQYMQRPVDLLSEAFRVLKPGGVLIVSFSNRMFFTKAIEVWRSQRNMKGLVNLVLNYFRDPWKQKCVSFCVAATLT